MLILLTTSLPLSANSRVIDLLIDKAMKKKLSEHSVWHKLMFYEPRSASITGIESAVVSDDFFLSETGRRDSLSEMVETIKEFSKESNKVSDEHAQCVFRGRYFWLKEQLDFSEREIKSQECPEYEEWSLGESISSISVVLATGYLGNPASYYGHLLVKMNTGNEVRRTSLEDVSINYGAIVPDNENPVVYIAKGIFGGYEAGFSHIQFYFHNHNYGENENRDLWEYELDLSYDEVQLVVAHAWESMRQKFDYFFLDKNCAYRVADLFAVVEGVDILPKNPLWVVPQSVIQKIGSAHRNDKPLVKFVSFHPSRQSRLYKRYSGLDEKEQAVVGEVVSNIDYLDYKDFENIGLVSRQRILDVLLDYYQYIRESQELDKDENNIKYRKVLSKRYQLPAGEVSVEFSSNNMPHQGRAPSMINIGVVKNEVKGNGARFVIRPAYYDSLDADYGHVRNASLSMAELQLIAFDGEYSVRSFDFVNIESVNSFVTGLPGDRGMGWKLRFGFEQQNLLCNKCLVMRLQGDMGMISNIGNDIVFGGYIGGGVQDNKNREGKAFVRASVFSNVELNRMLRLRFEAEQREYLHSEVDDGFKGSAWVRYSVSKNTDIRFGYEKNVADEISVSASFYW